MRQWLKRFSVSKYNHCSTYRHSISIVEIFALLRGSCLSFSRNIHEGLTWTKNIADTWGHLINFKTIFLFFGSCKLCQPLLLALRPTWVIYHAISGLSWLISAWMEGHSAYHANNWNIILILTEIYLNHVNWFESFQIPRSPKKVHSKKPVQNRRQSTFRSQQLHSRLYRGHFYKKLEAEMNQNFNIKPFLMIRLSRLISPMII